MSEPQRGRGAPPGNRNAWKTGLHSAPMRALRKDARLRLQKIKAAVAMARTVSSPAVAGEVARGTRDGGGASSGKEYSSPPLSPPPPRKCSAPPPQQRGGKSFPRLLEFVNELVRMPADRFVEDERGV